MCTGILIHVITKIPKKQVPNVSSMWFNFNVMKISRLKGLQKQKNCTRGFHVSKAFKNKRTVLEFWHKKDLPTWRAKGIRQKPVRPSRGFAHNKRTWTKKQLRLRNRHWQINWHTWTWQLLNFKLIDVPGVRMMLVKSLRITISVTTWNHETVRFHYFLTLTIASYPLIVNY